LYLISEAHNTAFFNREFLLVGEQNTEGETEVAAQKTALGINDLAVMMGEPPDRIAHAIKKRGIQPRGRIGIARFWHSEDIPSIVAAVKSLRVYTKPE
jgi:hypothetical protein